MKSRWASRIMAAAAILFLLFDCGIKILRLTPAVEGTVKLGYPESAVVGLGIIELICLVAYTVPATSVLGAILLTGYLGGAVATHVRLDHPLFTHELFPVYVAVLLWGALVLRDARLRVLLPVTRR
jgi:ABC-type uncharacterized transport system permease subunit